MTQVTTWWRYRTLWERLQRRKTFFIYNPDEDNTLAYQMNKDGSMLVIAIKQKEQL